MSRSAFVVRFKDLVGETPPLEYLTSWRMQKAATLLQKDDRKLIDVARSVGYRPHSALRCSSKRNKSRKISEGEARLLIVEELAAHSAGILEVLLLRGAESDPPPAA